MCHDTARIIQCLVKHAPMDMKSEIADKLKENFVDISKSKYAHFCIQRLLKYGSKNLRDKILNALFKNIAKLTLNNTSSAIIDNIYTFYASNDQKARMRQEFYSDLFTIEPNKNVKTLNDVLKDHTFMKNSVMAHIKKNILLAANKKVTENR
jgi:pumilio family protein 6